VKTPHEDPAAGPATGEPPAAHAKESGGSSVLSTLNADGSRRWLLPRLSKGRFLNARRAVGYALILVFTLIPYIKFRGLPLILLDLPARRFTFFGITLLPTDTLLLAFFMVSVFLAVFLATALLGRVWCGWACPQTVYMELVFRPIERFFDGAPGRAKKAWQGTPPAAFLKYLSFFVVACYLAHTFLAYFVGVDALRQWVVQSPFSHPIPFLVMACVTGLMLFDFCFFREQTCLVACPYGRMQSVMLDRHSLIVSYDPARGEPRGRARTGKPADLSLPVVTQPTRTGDCVDCGLCVTTCPTGIDIRNGLQMECIQCTQCIDACDAVMSKLGRPTGLIRYTSQAALAGEKPRLFRPRVIAYPLLLATVLTLFSVALASRQAIDTTILRSRGSTFTMLDEGSLVANTVRVKVVNRTSSAIVCELSLEEDGAVLRTETNPLTLAPAESLTVGAMFAVPAESISRAGRDVHLVVRAQDGRALARRKYHLVGPGTPLPPSGDNP
jgi:cytochrome c oxidase accessory protein FixG